MALMWFLTSDNKQGWKSLFHPFIAMWNTWILGQVKKISSFLFPPDLPTLWHENEWDLVFSCNLSDIAHRRRAGACHKQALT
jgi:hypothetical protein